MSKFSYFLTLCLICVAQSCINSNSNTSEQRNNSICGTYYWNYPSAPLETSHKIVVYEDHWTGTSIMYGERSYDSGLVRGNSLYDSSGRIEVARISGGRIDYGNHILKKQ